MPKLFTKKILVVVLALLFVGLALSLLFKALSPEPIEQVVAVVDEGPVRQLVSVSGIITAEDTADLSFPVSGTVKEVLVRKGEVVATGTILATLDNSALEADRREAVANLQRAQADLAELIAGTRGEAKMVSSETVQLKQTLLNNTEASEKLKVATARKAMLSNGLSAYSNDADEDAMAPTISGSYACDSEGQYKLEMFRSGSASGYSFKLSGLESGTFAASFDQSISFGNCGLRAQFFTDSLYAGSVWLIDIPNKKSPSYITFKNAYDLAQDQAQSSINLAKQELALAEATAKNNTAEARPEAILRDQALVDQATAKLSKIDSELADRTLKAPFSGTITSVDILPGEIVTTAPVITLLSSGRFELTARIPEIDIGKLKVNQKAEVVFDTKANEILIAIVDYLSPKATTIDGVAYYEARLILTSNPDWLRSGLNADVDIIVDTKEGSTRLPTRFVRELADGTYVVLKESGNTIATTTVEVLFRGNDGFIAISGLRSGERIIAP